MSAAVTLPDSFQVNYPNLSVRAVKGFLIRSLPIDKDFMDLLYFQEVLNLYPFYIGQNFFNNPCPGVHTEYGYMANNNNIVTYHMK